MNNFNNEAVMESQTPIMAMPGVNGGMSDTPASMYPNGAQYQSRMGANMHQQMMGQGMQSQQVPYNRARPVNARGPVPVAMNNQMSAKGVSIPSAHHHTTPVMIQKNSSFKGSDDNVSRANMQQMQSFQRQQMQQQMNASQGLQAKTPVNQIDSQPESLPERRTDPLPHQSVPPSFTQPGTPAAFQPPGAAMKPGQGSAGSIANPAAMQNGSVPIKGPMNPMALAQQQELNAKIFKRNLGNAGVMRVLDLLDLIGNEPFEMKSQMEFWIRIFTTYFSPSCVIRFTNATEQLTGNGAAGLGTPLTESTNPSRSFELNSSTAPKFFLINVLSNHVVKHQITLPGTKVQVMNNGNVFVVSRLSAIFNYIDGSTGNATGTCRILLTRDLRIERIDCKISEFSTSISMSSLKHKWSSFGNDNMNQLSSDPESFLHRLLDDTLCMKSSKNLGMHDDAFRNLQISDLMTQLRPIMYLTVANNFNSPLKAFEAIVSSNSNNASHLRSTSVSNGAASSPSPRSSNPDEAKGAVKKRKVSVSKKRPASSDSRR